MISICFPAPEATFQSDKWIIPSYDGNVVIRIAVRCKTKIIAQLAIRRNCQGHYSRYSYVRHGFLSHTNPGSQSGQRSVLLDGPHSTYIQSRQKTVGPDHSEFVHF